MSGENERSSRQSEPDQNSDSPKLASLSSVGGRVGVGARIGVAATSLLLSFLAIEVTFRLIGFDFEQKERALRTVPIFNRRPTEPTGETFYRRPGPAHWDGQVLGPMLRRRGIPEEVVPAEQEVSIFYDRDGFRNPETLEDWDVVVVGDSFTELGYLEYPDLFTTRVARALQVRVKNLGVSYTGTFTQVSYLRDYGGAPSARHAVLVFYEGNDIDDIVVEDRWRRRERERLASGLPRTTPMAPQSSLVVGLLGLLTRDRAENEAPEYSWVTPRWIFLAAGKPQRIMTGRLPPQSIDLRGQPGSLVAMALTEWSSTCQSMGMKPWLLYVPVKWRVLHDSVHDDEGLVPNSAKVTRAVPNAIRRMAQARGIEFIGGTRALRLESQRGRLTYNPIGDAHVNALGSKILGDVLADALAGAGVGRRRE